MPEDSKITDQNSLLSKWLNRKKNADAPKGVRPRPEGIRVPLALGQQRLLFLQQLYPENPFYHYADAYRFKGKLNVGYLIKSFEIAAQRHEILRAKVAFENGQAFQQINEKPLFEISEHDLRGIPTEEVEAVARNLAINEARKSLESPNGYLIRFSILWLKEDEFLFVLTMHHIIMDKWSMNLLQNEVAGYYRKMVNGEPVNFSPLEIQYADYAYAQSISKPNPDNLAYWTNKLQNSLGFLELPTDFPRPYRPTFRGAYATEKFSINLSNKLKTFCREQNKTLYTVILTAFKILLKRYSGENDILVGSPFTNRDEVALEKLIGFFDDTLVLRSDLSNDPTFIELLEKVWATAQAAFAHKNMPFEVLVKSLKPNRYLNHNPLFQVMFIYHNVPGTADFGENLVVSHEPFDFGVTKFDLTLFIAEKADEITATFEYSIDLFSDETIKRMQGHLKKLLDEIVDNPYRPISELAMISDEELKAFSGWNNTNNETIEAKSVVELFNVQVAAKFQEPALSFQNEKITYGELNQRANAIASYLLKVNPDPHQPIGLLVEPSIGMIVGILGILKAGRAYLPLDAQYPRKRLDFILGDSSVTVVLTQKHLSYLLADHAVSKQIIDEIINSESSADPVLPNEISRDQLAYILYTSGSTGEPKGVCVTHGNLLYSTIARFDFYPDQPRSFLLMSSFSFDSSVAGIFWTLLAGGKLVLIERRTEQDLNTLSDIFVSESITHTLLLPTLYQTLIRTLAKNVFETFRTIIVAGEACPKTLCHEHFTLLPDVALYNEYGPTEATVWATVHKITPGDSGLNVSIGKPVSNCQVYILDDNNNQVPIGVPGELFIGGKGVAKGYFNNPELTNKHFIQNIFASGFSDKLYKTGDRCRYRSDGTIEFLGRTDNQVKIRGYRVELGEIQEAIQQNANVREVVVKLETIQKTTVGANASRPELLLAKLENMSVEEADKMLKTVEKLSDQEIVFLLN
ncbi:MAG: amino acid adenylation domain-containing protein [Chitinophagaceae bacterium]|nr:MAG: amino acid adenylation domain-containing protein [Chitinophagaceae bacterium]